MNKFLIILILLLLTGFFVFNKSAQNTKEENNMIQVSASFYPLYYFASEIGGKYSVVKNVTPSGVEPHAYELTTKDMANIENSDMLILNGSLEPWGDKIKDNLSGSKVKIIETGSGFSDKQITHKGEKIIDPHTWLSPNLAKREVAKITSAYIATDPIHSDIYIQNQKTLEGKLDQLDRDYKSGLANCMNKNIVTSHTAFSFLALSYGLEQISVSGLSPDEEPSAKQLGEIVRFAKENDIKYIFFESLVSPKISQTIASEVGAKTLVLDPIEGLSDDKIKQGKNYFTVMRDNLTNLRIALQCKQ